MFSIKNIMTKSVYFTKQNTPIQDAINTLVKHKVSELPVVTEAMRVVGILLEKDLLQILFDDKLDLKRKVDDYMSREVICFTEDDNTMDISKLFIKSHLNSVPIVKDGKLVGVVSRRDIIHLILEAKNNISKIRDN